MIYTTLAFAMLSLAAGAPGDCEQHKDCHTCIEVDPTNNCGYCRDPVTSSTAAAGNRCVDINEKYNCPSDFWTDKCEAGFTCNMTSLQCVQSTVRPDYKTMADCQKSCVAQPPPPPTPSPTPVSPMPIGPPPPPTPARYQCQVVHNAPQCSECQPGGNATTGCHGQSYDTKDSCDKKCTHPDPPPPELIGLWRGLEIHQGPNPATPRYQTGEWVGEITNTSVKIYAPQTDGSYKKWVVGGAVSIPSSAAQYVLSVTSDADAILNGTVMLVAQDYQNGPEVGKYVQITVDEANPSTPLAAGGSGNVWDTGMIGATTKVLGLETCPGGAPPAQQFKCKPDTSTYHCDTATRQCIKGGTLSKGDCDLECGSAPSPPPPGQCVVCDPSKDTCVSKADCDKSCAPPTPPPAICHAKIDVSLLLDGSASISATNWGHAIDFAKDLASGFDMSPATGKVGVVQFSSDVREECQMTTDSKQLATCIGNINQMAGTTSTACGLDRSMQQLADEGRGAAANASITILVTDGKPNTCGGTSNTSTAAAALCAAAPPAHQLVGVCVGTDCQGPEIKDIVCDSKGKKPSNFIAATDWKKVDQLVEQIIQSVCPAPSPPPAAAMLHKPPVQTELAARFAARMSRFSPSVFSGAHRRLADGLPNDFHKCKFHLPSNLPAVAATKKVASSPAFPKFAKPSLKITEFAPPSDPCNVNPTCTQCLAAATAGGCGWCTGQLYYEGVPVNSSCSGKDGASKKWHCNASATVPKPSYFTDSCGEGCGLNGTFRGLRIDNSYEIGEWAVTFAPVVNDTQKTSADFKFLAADGSTKSEISGVMQCSGSCNDVKASAPFTLAHAGGSKDVFMHGICGTKPDGGSNAMIQAETNGLYIGLAPNAAPADWDSALTNVDNSTLMTLWNCSSWKTGPYNKPICTFK